jgi:spore coat polysaccharide biosynthesis predicted glycosyltransferase SpsG
MLALCIEASHARGMGHLFRSLALAEAVESQGGAVRFYLNPFAPAEALLRGRGRRFETVPPLGDGWEPDLIRRDGIRTWVNDRLDTTASHAARVRGAGAHLATFDDRGAGAAQSDLNIVAIPAANDEPLAGKRVLRGLASLVLDPAIARLRRPRSRLESLVVSLGGSDTYGVTIKVMRALKSRSMGATVVLGPGFAHKTELAAIADASFTLKRNVPSLAEEFSRHDLAITAGGVTPCEANAAGLPCIVIAAETWENRTGEMLEELGGSLFAGPRDRIDFSILDRLPDVAAMSRAALAHVPADGAARVAREILAL